MKLKIYSSKLIWPTVLIILILGFLIHFGVVGRIVWGDGQYYYAQVRSWAIDKDWQFKDELEYFGQPTEITKTGLTFNKYSIGPALFWLPWFWLTHLIVKGNGYSIIYQIVTGLSSILYGFLGLLICFKTLNHFFSKKISLLAVLGLLFTSNLFFYLSLDPISSHPISFFISSLIIHLWLVKKTNKFILGFLTGILSLIRIQNLVFVILFLKPLALFGAILGFLPQVLAQKKLFGSWQNGYLLNGENFNWLSPALFKVLFSSFDNGLLFYSPILIFSLIGLCFFKKPKLWLLVIVEYYLISSWHIWWAGASYGNRFFISLMPIFMLGLVVFLEKFKSKVWLGIISGFIVLNFYMMFRYLWLS